MYNVKLKTSGGIQLDTILAVTIENGGNSENLVGLSLEPMTGPWWVVVMSTEEATRKAHDLFDDNKLDLSDYPALSVDEEGEVDSEEMEWYKKLMDDPLMKAASASYFH